MSRADAAIVTNVAADHLGEWGVYDVGSIADAKLVLARARALDIGIEPIRELARVAAELRPDRIIIKELHKYLRGREEGEVPKMIEEELLRAGIPRASLSHVAREPDAVRAALTWARAGDLLLLPVHTHRDEVLSLLTRLSAAGWEPGQPVD